MTTRTDGKSSGSKSKTPRLLRQEELQKKLRANLKRRKKAALSQKSSS